MRLPRTASEKTIEIGPGASRWPGRRALALGALGAVVTVVVVTVALPRVPEPELMTIPLGPRSTLIEAELAVARLEAALDAREPREIQEAAIELRARLAPLSPEEREVVEHDAVRLLDQAERTIGELPPPAPPVTGVTPGTTGVVTTTPTTTSTSSPTTRPEPTTTTAPTSTSTTEAPSTTTTSVPEATTTTAPELFVEQTDAARSSG